MAGPSKSRRGRKKNGGISRLRTILSLSFFVFILGISVFGFLRERGAELPDFIPTCLHGICPFGGVVTLGTYLTSGHYIPRTGVSNLFSLAGVLGGTLIFGAFFCGWLCPLGSVQDWFGKIGTALRLKGRNIKPGSKTAAIRQQLVSLDRVLSFLRYGVLVLVLWTTYKSFNLAFSRIDPYYALFHFWTGTALPLSLAVLGAVLFLSLFISRPWCRWLCPMGALQGLFQKVAPWSVKRNDEACIGCRACDKACPFNIAVSEKDRINDSRCNRCLSCVAACPINGALDIRGAGNRYKRKVFRPASAAILSVILFALPWSAGAFYRYHTRTEPAFEPSVNLSGAGYGSPSEAVESLSGGSGLKETAKFLGLNEIEILTLLSLPPDYSADTKLRDIEEDYEEKTFRWIKEKIEAYLLSSEEEI